MKYVLNLDTEISASQILIRELISLQLQQINSHSLCSSFELNLKNFMKYITRYFDKFSYFFLIFLKYFNCLILQILQSFPYIRTLSDDEWNIVVVYEMSSKMLSEIIRQVAKLNMLSL